MATDHLSEELRDAKHEIDTHHLRNPLLRVDRGYAVYNLLNQASLVAHSIEATGQTFDEWAPRYQGLTAGLETALRWVWRANGEEGRTFYNRAYAEESALRLLGLGSEYSKFAFSYKLASEGKIAMRREDNVIIVEETDAQLRKGAYLLLAREDRLSVFPNLTAEVLSGLRTDLVWSQDRLEVRNAAHHRRRVRRLLAPLLSDRQPLPSNWRFRRYTLNELRSAIRTLMSEALIWVALWKDVDADHASLRLRCIEEVGVVEMLQEDGTTRDAAVAILEDFTFGNRGIHTPDFQQQPFFSYRGQILFAPILLLFSEWERNFVMLMNRIPEERAVYDRLKQEKESRMRQRIVAELPAHIRSSYGPISGRSDLPDVDLALIDDGSKDILLLELKWFEAPAEPREILHRSEDLTKADGQLNKLQSFDTISPGRIAVTVGADPDYRVSLAIVSENWIGHGFTDDPLYPVIRRFHFSRLAQHAASLRQLVECLDARCFLPIENEDYRRGSRLEGIVGRWKLRGDYVPEFDQGDAFIDRTVARLNKLPT